MEQGAELTWKWEMYDASTNVEVEKVDKDKRIVIRWNIDSDISNPSIVKWEFFPQKDDATFVIVTNKEFQGPTDEIVAEAIGSMGGFSFLLAAAKAWLEHGIELKLVLDHALADLKLAS